MLALRWWRAEREAMWTEATGDVVMLKDDAERVIGIEVPIFDGPEGELAVDVRRL